MISIYIYNEVKSNYLFIVLWKMAEQVAGIPILPGFTTGLGLRDSAAEELQIENKKLTILYCSGKGEQIEHDRTRCNCNNYST